MSRYRTLLLLLPLALLAGCGSSPDPAPRTTYPDLTGNWQIQSANVSGGSPVAQVLLLGALENSTANSAVSGTFRFSNLAQPVNCALNQIVSLSGTVDGSGNLSLSSPTSASGLTVKTQLHPSASVAGLENGTIEVDGTPCALASSPAIGVATAPLNGTFTGQLMTGPLGSGGSAAGTASLTLAQSSTPGADGQFPLTGTIGYVLGTCTGTASLSGDASGAGVTLASAGNPLALPPVSLLGTTDPAAEKLSLVSAAFNSLACPGATPPANVYSGTLNRQ